MQNIRYEELFRQNVVMTIEHLKLETGRPRESILRDLKNIGYYSSYNERGKFYTLDGTPDFDELGLWKYRNAYFSSRRTVLATAEYLICTSDAGHTHDELRQILGIGLQNTLYQLTTEDRITRRLVGDQYVYFGKENPGRQWEKRGITPALPVARKAARASDIHGYPDLNPKRIIDILIAVLRGHETEIAVYSHLRQTGLAVTEKEVNTVFRFYGIGKKNFPVRK